MSGQERPKGKAVSGRRELTSGPPPPRGALRTAAGARGPELAVELDRFSTYSDWCRSAYADSPQEHRAVGSSKMRLVSIDQPAGHFPDLEVNEVVLHLILRGDFVGHADFGDGRFEQRLASGHMLVAPALTYCDYLMDGPRRILSVGLSRSRLQENFAGLGELAVDFGPLHAGWFREPYLETTCRRLWDEAERNGSIALMFADGAFMALFAVLMRLRGEAVVDPGPRRIALAPQRLRRAKEFIEANLARDIGLPEIAAVVGLSAWHFARAFKLETGLPPYRYLTARRIELARELLATSDSDLLAIATACGFSSQQQFTSTFKRLSGIPPGRYRRTQRR